MKYKQKARAERIVERMQHVIAVEERASGKIEEGLDERLI
jgi:hypothetical protein